MQRTLAIAALLGLGATQQLPGKAQEGVDIARGFLVGSATAEGFTDVPSCIQDLGSVVSNGEKAIGDFKKKNLSGMIDGFEQVSAMLTVVKQSENDCRLLKADWAKIEQMAKTWKNPAGFAYHVGKDILINGKNIYGEINTAISDYEKKSFYNFGVQIGKASAQILLGQKQMLGQSQGAGGQGPKPDPKRQYVEKMGAEYAAGFLYGAKVGGFDEKSLFECLEQEPNADKLFLNADIELKTSIYKKDANMAVKGVTDMLKFVIDMALEREKDKDGKTAAACPELRDSKANWNDVRMIIAEMRHQETGIKFQNDRFTFNEQDITKEMQWAAQAYMNHDFKKLGFILGDTLDRHSRRHRGGHHQGQNGNHQGGQGGFNHQGGQEGQGGFNHQGGNQGGQGGFNHQGGNQGGFNHQGGNQGGEGGFNHQGGQGQGGFNQGGQGGFNQGGQREGGFNQGGQREGGQREGGFNQGGQGGFNQGGFNNQRNDKFLL